MENTVTPTFKVENMAQVLSCWLKFVHATYQIALQGQLLYLFNMVTVSSGRW
jgi:hypothetical protein